MEKATLRKTDNILTEIEDVLHKVKNNELSNYEASVRLKATKQAVQITALVMAYNKDKERLPEQLAPINLLEG